MAENAELQSVTNEALSAFKKQRDNILRETVDRSMAYPDQVAFHGEEAQEVITAGMRFTMSMLETAMSLGSVNLLENQLVWASDRLKHDGVQPEHILTRLRIMQEVIASILPEGFSAEINAFVSWMVNRQEQML